MCSRIHSGTHGHEQPGEARFEHRWEQQGACFTKRLQSKGMTKQRSREILDAKEPKNLVDKAVDKVEEKEKIREKANENLCQP